MLLTAQAIASWLSDYGLRMRIVYSNASKPLLLVNEWSGRDDQITAEGLNL
jgi:hypothetical protein